MDSTRKTLLIVAVLFSIPIVSIIIWMQSDGTPGAEASDFAVREVRPGDPEQQRLLDALEKAKADEGRPSDQQEAEAVIETHRQAMEADPESPENPARLSAMGNLYMQKFLDFQQAADCFETLLMKYPDWEKAPGIYPLLASCYEQLGDTKNEQIVYKQMMEKLPPESKEYEYAKFKLGIR